VYTFLNGLTPPALAAAMEGVAQEVAKTAPVIATAQAGSMVYSEMMAQVERGASGWRLRHGKGAALEAAEEDEGGRRQGRRGSPGEGPRGRAGEAGGPLPRQRLALVTYKSKQPSPQAALEEARELLRTLNPETRTTRRRWASGARCTSGCGS